jgi:hypothetical protein
MLQLKASDGFANQTESFNLETELKKPGAVWDLVRVIRWPKQSVISPASPNTGAGPVALAVKRLVVEKQFLNGRRELELKPESEGVILNEGRWGLRLVDDDHVLYMWPSGPRLAFDATSEQLEPLDTWYKHIASASVDE